MRKIYCQTVLFWGVLLSQSRTYLDPICERFRAIDSRLSTPPLYYHSKKYTFWFRTGAPNRTCTSLYNASLINIRIYTHYCLILYLYLGTITWRWCTFAKYSCVRHSTLSKQQTYSWRCIVIKNFAREITLYNSLLFKKFPTDYL